MPHPLRAGLVAALIACPALPAAADTPTGQAKLDRMLAGRVAGKPSSCVTRFLNTDSTNIDGIGVAYRQGSTIWVSRFQGGCPMLRSDTFLVTRTPTDQQCSGDIAQVVSSPPGIPMGSCVFGPFVPYTKPKGAAAQRP